MLLESSLCKPGGLGARDTLRLEMGYPLYGHELTHDLSPTSFSERAFINFKKDFIGKNNVLKELNNPSKNYRTKIQFKGLEKVIVFLV